VKSKGKTLIELFLSLFKIGLFTFGGGYAMISLLDGEFVSKKHWIDKEEFLDLVAIAESTPGPIAINAATYVGFKKAGFLGAVVGTLAMCLPSFIIIYAISLFLDEFLGFKLVESAFRGIQVCVIYLVFSAGIKMAKNMKKNTVSNAIMISVVSLMIIFALLCVKFSSIIYILISGVIGLLIYVIKQFCDKKEETK
jgi:chromate transporter